MSILESKGAPEEGRKSLYQLLMGFLQPFTGLWPINKIKPPLSVPEKTERRLFENDSFPLDLFFEKGKELGLQKQSLRTEKIKSAGTILDTKIIKRDSHSLPQTEFSLPNGDLSTEGVG